MSTNSAHSLQYTVVDAFTDKVFSGNPAAVIILDDSSKDKLEAVGGIDHTLQLIAREFNLSETAFVSPKPNQGVIPTFGLRWFTPKKEVLLCGHATLASAHALFATPGLLPSEASLVHFETLSGTLTAKRIENGKIELEFPAGIPTEVNEALEKKAKDAIKKAINQEHNVTFVGVARGVSFETYTLIELEAPFDLQNAIINPGALLSLAPEYSIIILTTKSASPNSFVSRTFAPYVGVPEDPVTGSAHCMLGPYWHQKLGLRALDVLHANQVSERGGILDVIWDQEKNTCRLIGQATMATKGELFLPTAGI